MTSAVPNVGLAVALGNGVPFGRGPSVWIATLTPILRTRLITGVAVDGGPQSSNIAIFFDATLVDTTPYGVRNQQEYTHPKYLYRGTTMRIIWSLGTGVAPRATIDYRFEARPR